MRRSSFEVSVSTLFFEYPLRLLRFPAAASPSRWSSISAFRTRSAKAFFSSSNSPSLAKTACGSRPASKPSRVSFLIAICALHRRHYGPTHKIPDSPPGQYILARASTLFHSAFVRELLPALVQTGGEDPRWPQGAQALSSAGDAISTAAGGSARDHRNSPPRWRGLRDARPGPSAPRDSIKSAPASGTGGQDSRCGVRRAGRGGNRSAFRWIGEGRARGRSATNEPTEVESQTRPSAARSSRCGDD